MTKIIKLSIFSMLLSLTFEAKSQPTIDSPFSTWSSDSEPHSGPNFSVFPDCDDLRYSVKTLEYTKIECKPDTLYSWTDIKWADMRLDGLSSSWNGIWRHLFLTRAPIATFPYGNISLRVKLRPGIKFKHTRGRCEVPVQEAETTVYFRNFGFSEFIICSPKVIHSISYGTKEHFDEIVRDYIQHKKRPMQASYYYIMGGENRKYDIFSTPSVDNVEFSYAILKSNLQNHLSIIEKERTRLLFNPELNESEQSESEHFRTDKPIYFNPQ